MRREHSQHELKTKLAGKGYSATDIEQEIALLQKAGLQSDERFADSWCRTKIAAGHGPIRIKYDLQQHRVEIGRASCRERV